MGRGGRGPFWYHFEINLFNFYNLFIKNMKIIKQVFFVDLFCLVAVFYLAGDGEWAGDHFRNTLYVFRIIPI